MGVLFSWLVFALIGTYGTTVDLLRIGAVARRAWMEAYTRNLREFMTTDDLAGLAAKPFPLQLPFPDPLLLANAWLRHPYLRGVLPSEMRDPLKIATDLRQDGPFVANGAYPTTPTDPDRPSLGSFTTLGNPSVGRFESRTLPPCHRPALLKFQVAGYLGEPKLSLSLREVASGRQKDVQVPGLAMEQWIDARIPCPAVPFTVVAEDHNPDYWFAFREPIEVGWLTAIADSLVARGFGLLLISLAAAGLVLRLT
jgi:hypothetical protein